MIARLAAATAAALLLVACGGDGGGRYGARVDATRDAIRAGDREAALASLDELGADALRAHADGDVSEEELVEVTALVEHARAQIDSELPESATTTTPPPTTTEPPPPVPAFDVTNDDGDDERGNRGRGRGGDDGDDDDDD